MNLNICIFASKLTTYFESTDILMYFVFLNILEFAHFPSEWMPLVTEQQEKTCHHKNKFLVLTSKVQDTICLFCWYFSPLPPQRQDSSLLKGAGPAPPQRRSPARRHPQHSLHQSLTSSCSLLVSSGWYIQSAR